VRVCEACGACSDDDYEMCGADGAHLKPSVPGGRVLSGRYRLERRLAGGTMGQVFEAVHLAVGSHVAVKIMQPEQRELSVSVQRFHREARMLGAIKHPHAVLITDFDVDDRPGGPVAFLVTELLRGRPLSALLEEKGRLTLDAVERVIVPLCDAVGEAHAVGIIHRDLKPTNVFLERLRDGSEIVKVLDFGIAKLLVRQGATPEPIALPPIEASSPSERALRDEIHAVLEEDDEPRTLPGRRRSTPPQSEHPSTYSGLMVGTVPYMAAEQMTGERVTRRTDVHALGVMVFEMLTGQLPFDGEDDDIISQKLSGEVPSLREHGIAVDERLEAVVLRCLSANPDDRPESVAEVRAAVQAAAARARGGVDDPVGTVVLRLSTTARALARASEGAPDLDLVRDTLLSASATLARVQPVVDGLARHIAAPPQAGLVSAHLELDDALASVRDVLGTAQRQEPDRVASLMLLWRRIDDVSNQVGGLIDGDTHDGQQEPEAESLDVLDVLELLKQPEPSARPWGDVLAGLSSKDALDVAESIDDVLGERVDDVVRVLAEGGPEAETLINGLWRAADLVLLRDLGVERGALRYLPLLAGHALDRGRFAKLVGALRDRRGIIVVDDAMGLEEGARDSVLRGLLLHPIAEVRQRAAAALPIASLWSIAGHPRTPLPTHGVIFRQLKKRGHVDHLKIFFFCVRDALLSAPNAELSEAVALVREFFELPAFHEDLLFEPLLEVERSLRERAGGAGLLDESYARAFAAFMGADLHDEVPLEHLRDVPLALQRKLAREGRFLSTFVSHSNERIARETITHLLRLEDVTRYLRQTTIHRVVLVELAKRRRFFKKDAPKVALLANPKTPAAIARGYIGLVSDEQLRLLAANRQINPDVRRLITQALAS